MSSADYAVYIAGLPCVLAGAAALFRDAGGRVLLVEPNNREGWALPDRMAAGPLISVSDGTSRAR